MTPISLKRRSLLAAAGSAWVAHSLLAALPAAAKERPRMNILDTGAVGDGRTLNTEAIQRAIDRLASEGGGTVQVPAGVFVSGALFLKPGVHLHLDPGAVIRCSTELRHFPPQRTWIEGHYEAAFNPALINASACHGLRISGEGTLDGAGRPVWDEFWARRRASGQGMGFRNLDVARARLMIIEKSQDVQVEGITFKDSQFWNLHLYRCQGVVVRNARFEVPDDYVQAPSSDGIDIDSSQDVTVSGCWFSVTDDCIALKGAKGPDAPNNPDSPAVRHVRVKDCTFRRGHAAVNMGSEAWHVSDVVVEDIHVTGDMNVLGVKLRPDTPQVYEDIHFRGVTLDASGGQLVKIYPWTQYFDLKGAAPPRSRVQNISMSDVRGRYGAFGSISGNPGQTVLRDIRLEGIEVTFEQDAELKAEGVERLVLDAA